MKYCVPYFKGFQYINEVDEIEIIFHDNDLTFIERLINKEFNNRIIIRVEDIQLFQENSRLALFQQLKLVHEVDFKLKFENYNPEYDELFQEIKDSNIPFFFDIKAGGLDVFYGLMELGVSDIYIVNELGFSLGKLGPIAHAAGISIRVFANFAQDSWGINPGIKSFFIRPEDIQYYESYVDVVEFMGELSSEFEVYYKIYGIQNKWEGNLDDLIIGLNTAEPVDNKTMVPEILPKTRLTCQKGCLVGKKCSLCELYLDVSKTLSEKALYFDYVLKS